MNLLVLCVSDKPARFSLNIPFFNLTDTTRFPRTKNKARIDFLAEKWNICHREGLEEYPETTHILNIGTYYLPQISGIRALIKRYEEIGADIILAGNVWAKMVDRLLVYYKTYDYWAFPDLEGLKWRFRPENGTWQVSSVGMPCIYPIEAWRRYPFHNPENMDDGIWYNQFCRDSGLPVLCDLSIRFYRTYRDSDIKSFSMARRFYHSVIWNAHHEIVGIKRRLER